MAFVVFETKSSFFALNQFLLFFLFLSIIKQNKNGRRKHTPLSPPGGQKKKDLGISQSERRRGRNQSTSRGEKRAKKKRFLLLHRYDALLLPNTIEREHIFSPETIA